MTSKTRDQLLKEFALKRELLKLIDRCVEIQLELEKMKQEIYSNGGTKKHGNT